MSAARRVLLVDDEPRIVVALQRLLRPHRARWDVAVATSGREALEQMELAPFDVVVTDMRMPLMDGASLLTITRDKYPGTMRLVLSGQSDADAVRRVAGVAHRFLSKPTEPAALLEALERVGHVHSALADPSVRAAVDSVDVTRSLPAVYTALRDLPDDDGTSLESVASILVSAPAVMAAFFRIVSSPEFDSPMLIASLTDAIASVTRSQLTCLVDAITMALLLAEHADGFDVFGLLEHSAAVARVAHRLAGDDSDLAETSFAAGLFHDFGKLVMAAAMPAVYAAIIARCRQSGASFEAVEMGLASCGHAKLALCLLDVFGIPFEIGEAVLDQQTAMPGADVVLRSCDLVQQAHRLVTS